MGQTDGVVAWESAHLPEAETEIVVESSHSAQGSPQVIAEVRRILLEHLEKFQQGTSSERIRIGAVSEMATSSKRHSRGPLKTR